MARQIPLQIIRTTRANLNTQRDASGLLQGELYLVTDESALAVGTATNAYANVSGGSGTVSADVSTPARVLCKTLFGGL